MPDNRVLYVGKGHGSRMSFHQKVIDHPQNKLNQRPMYQGLRAELTPGKSFIARKVFESADEIVCLLEEQRRIHEYGFDNLLNVASHAFTGRRMKPAVGRLIASKLKAYVQRCRDQYGSGHPPEVAAKIAASNRGKQLSSEHIQKIRDLHASGKMDHVHVVFTDAGRRAQSERGFSEEHRKALSISCRGRKYPNRRRPGIIQKQDKMRYKGVSLFKGKWVARITIEGKVKMVGVRSDDRQAAVLYDNAAEKLFGKRPNATERSEQVQSAWATASSLKW